MNAEKLNADRNFVGRIINSNEEQVTYRDYLKISVDLIDVAYEVTSSIFRIDSYFGICVLFRTLVEVLMRSSYFNYILSDESLSRIKKEKIFDDFYNHYPAGDLGALQKKISSLNINLEHNKDLEMMVNAIMSKSVDEYSNDVYKKYNTTNIYLQPSKSTIDKFPGSESLANKTKILYADLSSYAHGSRRALPSIRRDSEVLAKEVETLKMHAYNNFKVLLLNLANVISSKTKEGQNARNIISNYLFPPSSDK